MEFSLTDFQPVADRVWRAVANPASVTIGLIAGRTGALVVDTGSSPAQGAAIRSAAERVAGVPLVGAAVTHAHFDHFYGLAAFDDLSTYGHETLALALRAGQVQDEAHELGFVPDELRPPNRPLALARMVDLGDRHVEIVHFGPGHTAGDVVVMVPDAHVVFVGDLLEQSAPPSMGPDCDLKQWPAALDGVLGTLKADSVLIPGHGEPMDRASAFNQRAQISAVYGQAELLIGQGVAEADAVAAGDWPFDDATIATALPTVYAQLAAEGKRPGRHLPLL